MHNNRSDFDVRICHFYNIYFQIATTYNDTRFLEDKIEYYTCRGSVLHKNIYIQAILNKHFNRFLCDNGDLSLKYEDFQTRF